MRITHFEAENFKRLKAVSIDPDTNTVVIAGRNAQGKTSVLDGIMAALAGKAGAKELVRPVRDGETKARVVVELDDLRIERKWSPSGSTLTVGPKDGAAKLNSPQAVLDRLIGALSFDPLAFAEAAPKDQVATLIDLIGREKFDELASARKGSYERRTDVNREVKSLSSRVAAFPSDVPMVGSVPRIDVAAVVSELDTARRKQALRDEYDRLSERLAEIASEGHGLAETRPVAELTELIADAEHRNSLADKAEQRQAIMAELAEAERESGELTSHIEILDNARTELIESAELPVDGLTFDDEGVAYHGVPFVQASAAERLKVSVAMAMALNPELRVICIRDASLLDVDSRRALVAMAEEHDYQIWYEVVGDGGPVGVVIEDGEVQS